MRQAVLGGTVGVWADGGWADGGSGFEQGLLSSGKSEGVEGVLGWELIVVAFKTKRASWRDNELIGDFTKRRRHLIIAEKLGLLVIINGKNSIISIRQGEISRKALSALY